MLNWFASPSMGRELDVKFLSDAYDDITAPAWVSVEEELPKVDEQTTLSNECVVVDSSGAKYFGYYNGTDECWYTDDYTMILFVTHWMPLPTPPVKKGGQDAR